MPDQNPSSVLKNFIFITACVQFVLDIIAAALLYHQNGTVNNTVWAIGVMLIVQAFLGSVADWVDGRNQENWLRVTLQERDAPTATYDVVNANLVQTGATRPMCPVAARNNPDTHATNGMAWNSTTTTIAAAPANTLSPNGIRSTDSSSSISTSPESLMGSQAENLEGRSRNQGSSGMATQDGVEQRLTPALTHLNTAIDVPASYTDTNGSMLPPAPGASFDVQAQSTNDRPVTIQPTTVGIDKQGDRSVSTMHTSPCAPLETVASSDDSQSNEQAAIEKIIHSGPLATSPSSPIPVASPTIPAISAEPKFSLRSQVDDSQGQNPKLVPVAAGDDVELEVPALTYRNTIHVAPSTIDTYSSTLPPAPDASLVAEAKSTNEESAITIEDGVDVDTRGTQSSSREQTEPASLKAAGNLGCDSGYSEEASSEQHGTMPHDILMTTNIHSALLVALGEATEVDM